MYSHISHGSGGLDSKLEAPQGDHGVQSEFAMFWYLVLGSLAMALRSLNVHLAKNGSQMVAMSLHELSKLQPGLRHWDLSGLKFLS